MIAQLAAALAPLSDHYPLPFCADLKQHEIGRVGAASITARGERLLIPRMGPVAEVLAAGFRGRGILAEALPMPDREAIRMGRRHTSGKECVPMAITLGSVLQRLERERETTERFSIFMPSANGPCRFGVYHVLYKMTLERLGWADRVSVWSPVDEDYFEGQPGGFSIVVCSGFAVADVLLAALYDSRPVEAHKGDADEIYARYSAELHGLIEATARRAPALPAALLQVANGGLFGCASLLQRAAAEFAAIKRERDLPTVLVVGEIYVRCDPASNDFVVEQLERRGLRARFAPFGEWLEYTDLSNRIEGLSNAFGDAITERVRRRIYDLTYRVAAGPLAWPERATPAHALAAAEGYLSDRLVGEPILTVGGAVHEWRHGLIDGVVNVGPLECMPTKIAEAQLFHAAEKEGLCALTLELNGDPLDPVVLDNFAFDIKARHHARGQAAAARRDPSSNAVAAVAVASA